MSFGFGFAIVRYTPNGESVPVEPVTFLTADNEPVIDADGNRFLVRE